jgi:hypothetical protein
MTRSNNPTADANILGRMNRRLDLGAPSARALLLLLLSIASAASGGAALGATRSFRQSSAKDFEEGETTGSSILPDGQVVPGLRTARVALEAAFVWCSAASRDGGTIYFGTGDEGKVFAVEARADQRLAPASRLVVKLDVPWVSALAARADGRLLAAGNPGGGLSIVDPTRGTRVPFARVPAAHIWAIAEDEGARTTYVATGIPGKVFAIDATGRVRALWDAHDAHVLALLREENGTLLAGTSERAILYRVSLDGHAEAVHDFEADEVRAIARAPSGLYVAVNDFDGPGGGSGVAPAGSPASTSPVAAKGTKVAPPTSGGIAGGGGGGPAGSSATGAIGGAGLLPRPGLRRSRAALYRIDGSGRIEQVFALGDGYLTSLLVAKDGSVYAASGAEGRVYRIRPDDTAALVIDVPERQVLTMAPGGGGRGAAGARAAAAGAAPAAGATPPELWLGTGDAAAVYAAHEAGTPGAEGARYLSRVLDAEHPAAWGALHWRGDHVTFETRSGNTAKPDGSWRPWRALAAANEQGGAGVGHIDAGTPSLPARYLQYRGTLVGREARLREVTLYYLPQNQRPRVTQIGLADTGAASGGGAAAGAVLGTMGAASGASAGTSSSSANPGGRAPHAPLLKLRWKVDNDDGDELVYRLSVRPLEGSVWRPLAGMGGGTGDPLTRAELDWNTESIPDGQYVVRVTASDERSQPVDRALSSSLDSEPLLVDNRKPDVLPVKVAYPTVTGRVEDRASPITEIAVAIDGGEWHLLSPSDGIADEKVESFSFTLPKLARGPHAVAIRATDSNDNLGAVQLEVTAP